MAVNSSRAIPLRTSDCRLPTCLPSTWDLLHTAAAAGVTNMAVDAALLDLARRSKRGVWRQYAWERPTVSFGRNEQVTGRYSAASLDEVALERVRRPTGGRALLHWREITYAVAFPLGDDVSWRVPYAEINTVLLAALRELGVAAELAPERRHIVRLDGPVCFAAPAAGEITVAGRKLVGSAVWRERGAYLQHGSILLADDQGLLARASLVPQDPAPHAATLETCGAAHVTSALFAESIGEALGAAAGSVPIPNWHASTEAFGEAFARSVAEHEQHFADVAWLWRR